MKLRNLINKIAKKISGRASNDIDSWDGNDHVVSHVDSKWNGQFAPSKSDLATVDTPTRPQKVSEGLPFLPTGAMDTGPSPAESKHLNDLYLDSDRFPLLPSGHFYLYLDGQPVKVVKNMRVDDGWDSIYFDSWDRAGFRVSYEQEENG